jgi:histone H3/H4
MERDALEALREVDEAHLVRLFECKFRICGYNIFILICIATNLAAIHAKRVTIQKNDMVLVQRLFDGWAANPSTRLNMADQDMSLIYGEDENNGNYGMI